MAHKRKGRSSISRSGAAVVQFQCQVVLAIGDAEVIQPEATFVPLVGARTSAHE